MIQKNKPLYQRFMESRNSVKIMKPEECAWLAAAIDGEGTIGLYRNGKEGRRVNIVITNTNAEFVNHAKEIVGNIGSMVHYHEYSSGFSRKLGLWYWSLGGSNRSYAVIKQILPYLIIKREKAKSVIEEIDNHPFGRWSVKTEEGQNLQRENTRRSWQNPIIRQERVESIKRALARRKEMVAL